MSSPKNIEDTIIFITIKNINISFSTTYIFPYTNKSPIMLTKKTTILFSIFMIRIFYSRSKKISTLTFSFSLTLMFILFITHRLLSFYTSIFYSKYFNTFNFLRYILQMLKLKYK